MPARRAGLVISPLGNKGEFVVKDRDSTEFFHLGEEESFPSTVSGARTRSALPLSSTSIRP
jgi:hypothetical protein